MPTYTVDVWGSDLREDTSAVAAAVFNRIAEHEQLFAERAGLAARKASPQQQRFVSKCVLNYQLNNEYNHT